MDACAAFLRRRPSRNNSKGLEETVHDGSCIISHRSTPQAGICIFYHSAHKCYELMEGREGGGEVSMPITLLERGPVDR